MRATETIAAAALVLALGGCGSDDTDAEPTATPSATASPSSSTEPSPSSTVTPATGPLLEVPGVQMNAPAGWKQSDDIVTFSTTANPPTGIGAARLGSLELPGPATPLDESARLALRDIGGEVKRLPDVEVAGEQFYQLAGLESSRRYTVSLGTVARGYDVVIDFDFNTEMSAAERDRLVSESLSTFAWK